MVVTLSCGIAAVSLENPDGDIAAERETQPSPRHKPRPKLSSIMQSHQCVETFYKSTRTLTHPFSVIFSTSRWICWVHSVTGTYIPESSRHSSFKEEKCRKPVLGS